MVSSYDPSVYNPMIKIPTARQFRRLYIDIETSPNVVFAWKTGYKLNIDHNSIITERAIICVCWRWQGETKAHSLTWDKHQNDKDLITQLIPVLVEADEIVTHNGLTFDVPWLRTRALFHDLILPPDIKVIDTCNWARRHFYFNSNKLDYVSKYLKMQGKIKTEYKLWRDIVLEKCPKALAKMVRYCIGDINLLEGVWKRLAPFVPHRSHVGVLTGGEKWTDPRTGSTNVKIAKTRISAAGTMTYQMQSKDTGAYYTISERAYKAYLDAKGTRLVAAS